MYVWERRRHAPSGFCGQGDGRFGRTSSPLPGGHLERTDAACVLGAGGVEYDSILPLATFPSVHSLALRSPFFQRGYILGGGRGAPLHISVPWLLR